MALTGEAGELATVDNDGDRYKGAYLSIPQVS